MFTVMLIKEKNLIYSETHVFRNALRLLDDNVIGYPPIVHGKIV